MIFFFPFCLARCAFFAYKGPEEVKEISSHQDVPSPFPLMCNISDRLTADKKNNKKSQLVYWGPVTCLTPSTHVHSCQRWLDDMVEIYSAVQKSWVTPIYLYFDRKMVKLRIFQRSSLSRWSDTALIMLRSKIPWGHSMTDRVPLCFSI